MPNWCMNTLSVSGKSEELKRFVFACQGLPAKYPPQEWEKRIEPKPPEDTVPYFCFNALVPTPQQVLDIGFDGHEKYPSVNMLAAVYTGTDCVLDGYHWNIRHWGTKWDVYYDKITPEDMGWNEGGESIEFEFDTAWSPPREWFEAVAMLFPTLVFKMHYEEPGCFFAGDIYGEEGVICEDAYDQQQCEETFAYLLDEDESELDDDQPQSLTVTGGTK